jgi:photosystem II stability/assembly factor-like uncharacterized protein
VFRLQEAFSVLCVPGRVLAGSGRGLAVSRDNGGHWAKVKGELSSVPVYGLVAGTSGTVVYLAAENGIYKSQDSGDSWERILVCGSGPEDEQGDNADREEEPVSVESRRPLIAAAERGELYVYCRGRAYSSVNGGSEWKELSSQGLSRYTLRGISAGANGAVYATDGSGVFSYSFISGIWVELPAAAGIRRINNVALSPRGAVYLLCDNGIIRLDNLPPPASEPCRSLSPEDMEPGIREVQNAAVALSDAGQEKIFYWRKRAAARGWLPKVSFSTQRNGTDLWHWEGGSTTRQEDDCLRKGKYTQEWSVSLSWELGDLIWSADQTSIDVRSKLTAELRQDIIEQVSKAYFERLRVRTRLP